MDYEKKYKEALERAREFVSKDNVEVAEYIFPELTDLKDEKIRKVLTEYFLRYKEQEECGVKTFYGIPTNSILAWLEKQKYNGEERQ